MSVSDNHDSKCEIGAGQPKFRHNQTNRNWRLSSANMLLYCLLIAATSHSRYKKLVCHISSWQKSVPEMVVSINGGTPKNNTFIDGIFP